jgi:homoserine kinase type II
MIADDRTLNAILDAWPIGSPRRYEQVYSGLNNHSWRVTCPEGAYFVRIYQNARDPAHLRYEHALLHALQNVELSFRVPIPVATRAGDTLHPAKMVDERGVAVERVAALVPLLPGHHPDRTDPAEIGIAGGALGELDRALATVRIDRAAPTFRYADLDAIHPAVPDPLALPDELADSDAQRQRLHDLFATVIAAIPTLYGTLPQQIIHNDSSIGNYLVADGRATGVLDFEFAARDLRALDFVVGLYFIALNQALQQGAVAWERVEAFCRGYGDWIHLTEAEVAALPTLLRLRSLVGLIHWTGRARLGFATTNEAIGYRDDALRNDAWLTEQGTDLVTNVRHWLAAGSDS